MTNHDGNTPFGEDTDRIAVTHQARATLAHVAALRALAKDATGTRRQALLDEAEDLESHAVLMCFAG